MLGTQLLKRLPWLSAKIWARIPVGYRFLVPIVAAMGMAFVHGFLTHETLTASIWDVIKIAFTAMGGAAALKESPLPWDGGKGGVLTAAKAPRLVPPLDDAIDDDKTPVDGTGPRPSSSPPPAA